MHSSLIVLSALVLAAAPRGASNVVPVSNCLISLIEEAQVPAQEAGVLLELKAREGQQVAAGELVAQIDDAKTQMEFRVADAKRRKAEEEARNDVNIRYTTAASRVAEAEYQKNLEANKKVPGSVPLIEIQKLWLKWQETLLSIEKAQMDQRIAKCELAVAGEEVKASEENLRRRQIRSPIDAVVVELKRHNGEWVQPGDPVMHVVRINRLRVEGFLNTSEVAPSQISMAKEQVKITVPLVRGQKPEEVWGTVVFINPLVNAGGEYRIFVEVDNYQKSGHWVLRPGLTAEMSVQLK